MNTFKYSEPNTWLLVFFHRMAGNSAVFLFLAWLHDQILGSFDNIEWEINRIKVLTTAQQFFCFEERQYVKAQVRSHGM